MDQENDSLKGDVFKPADFSQCKMRKAKAKSSE